MSSIVRVFDVQDVYQDAVLQLQRATTAGQLSQREFEILTKTTDPKDVIKTLQEAIEASTVICQSSTLHIRDVIEPMLLRFERFGSAIDLLAQSSPNAFGINICGLVWGSMKFLLTVSL